MKYLKKVVHWILLLVYVALHRVWTKILVWELRTGHPKANQHLQDYLDKLPQTAKEEWLRLYYLESLQVGNTVTIHNTKDEVDEDITFTDPDEFERWFDENIESDEDIVLTVEL